MVRSYITRAVLAHANLLAARGLADGRPIRIDGFSPDEASGLRVALEEAHTQWRVRILASDNNEGLGQVNAERATRYRNEAASSAGTATFVLLAPLGAVVEASLNEPAFYVIARATIFAQALTDLRHDLSITASDVQALRESAMHSQPEAVYALLDAWDPLTGSIEADAPLDFLGLLADSCLASTSIKDLRAHLRRNSEAVEILMRPGVAPGRMVGELITKVKVSGHQRDELIALREWLVSGRLGVRPALADLANWHIEGEVGDPPALTLQPNLANAPHSGWIPSEPAPEVEDPAGTSKLVWSIENRRPGLRVEIDVIEEASQTVVKSLGRTQALAKTIKWSQALGHPDTVDAIREANPTGEYDGYLFRLRLRLVDGKNTLDDPETEPFQVDLERLGAPSQATKRAPTAWHALYKLHTERGASPILATVSPDDATAITVDVAGARSRDVRIDLSPVLVAIERSMLDAPQFAGSWNVHLTEAMASAPTGLELVKTAQGTQDADLLRARAAFFRAVQTSGIFETLDTRDPDVRTLALAYVDAWSGLAERLAKEAQSGYGLAHQARLNAASLASIDTIRLIFPGEFEGDAHEVLLVAPLHPAVVAWALDFHDLVHEWTRGSFDHAIKPPYRSTANASAVLGGVEGFSSGPRAMVAFTAFDNEVVPTGWAYSGSLHPLWQCFVRVTGDVGARSREWPEDLARLLALSAVPAGGNRIDAARVGSRLKKYAILHPYVRQMKIVALVAGDGHPLLDALKVIDEKSGTPTGAQSIRELRYELQVIGPRSDRLGSAIEDLASNPGDGRWRGYATAVLDNPETVLAPGFAFGITGIDARPDAQPGFWPVARSALEAMPGGANVTIFGALLATGTRPVVAPDAPAGFGARGLVARPSTVLSGDGVGPFAGNWTLVIPRPHPSASMAGSAQHALLRLCDVAGGAQTPNHQVGLDVGLAGPVSATLAMAHEKSDWVIIADPLFSVELMDRPGAGGGMLLDYTPEFDAYPGGRVVVSTSTLSELDKLDASNPEAGVASQALAKVLSSISARLLLTLANPTKQVVRGLHGLALTRVFFRIFLPNAVVIPMDGHADMFAVPRVSGTSRLADLLAVSVIDGRLHLAVIESKWVGKANLAAKVKDGAAQARTSMEVLKAEFLEYPGVDRVLRIDALREIILFHLERAKRHGLPQPFSREDLIAATASEDVIRKATIDAHVVVWCPDLVVDADSDDEEVAVVQFGESDIRRYAAAMNGWPDAALPDAVDDFESGVVDAIIEQLIDSTLEDDLAEQEALETGEPRDGEQSPTDEQLLEVAQAGEQSTHRISVEKTVTNGQRDQEPDEPEPSGEPGGPTPPGHPPESPPASIDIDRVEPESGATTVTVPARGIVPIRLGARVRGGETVTWDPSTLANGHVAVLGGSGAGKTTLLRKFARCITHLSVPVLVLDFHGDLYLPGGEYSHDFSYEGNASFINPLHLDPAYARDISPSRLKWEFMEAWHSQYPTLGIQQRNYLTTLIEDAYGAAGVVADPASWTKQIDFSDVLDAFERSDASEPQKQRIDAYMKQYREWSVFHGGEPISVESMLRRSTRLNLSQLDSGARNIVADVVLRRLFLLAKALGPIPEGTTGWDRFRAYVVIDEAQVLLTSNSDAKASLAKYASEARKFGIGLILATQLRDNIPGDVWGNIDTRLWMLALDQVERQKNARAANLPEQSIAALKVGEAFLVASSQPGTRPDHLKIDPAGC